LKAHLVVVLLGTFVVADKCRAHQGKLWALPPHQKAALLAVLAAAIVAIAACAAIAAPVRASAVAECLVHFAIAVVLGFCNRKCRGTRCKVSVVMSTFMQLAIGESALEDIPVMVGAVVLGALGAHACGVVVKDGRLGQCLVTNIWVLALLAGIGLGTLLGCVALASGMSWLCAAALGANLASICALLAERLQWMRPNDASSTGLAASAVQIGELSGIITFGVALAQSIRGNLLGCLGVAAAGLTTTWWGVRLHEHMEQATCISRAVIDFSLNGGAAMALSAVLALPGHPGVDATNAGAALGHLVAAAAGACAASLSVFLDEYLEWFYARGLRTAAMVWILAGGSTVAMVHFWLLAWSLVSNFLVSVSTEEASFLEPILHELSPCEATANVSTSPMLCS